MVTEEDPESYYFTELREMTCLVSILAGPFVETIVISRPEFSEIRKLFVTKFAGRTTNYDYSHGIRTG